VGASAKATGGSAPKSSSGGAGGGAFSAASPALAAPSKPPVDPSPFRLVVFLGPLPEGSKFKGLASATGAEGGKWAVNEVVVLEQLWAKGGYSLHAMRDSLPRSSVPGQEYKYVIEGAGGIFSALAGAVGIDTKTKYEAGPPGANRGLLPGPLQFDVATQWGEGGSWKLPAMTQGFLRELDEAVTAHGSALGAYQACFAWLLDHAKPRLAGHSSADGLKQALLTLLEEDPLPPSRPFLAAVAAASCVKYPVAAPHDALWASAAVALARALPCPRSALPESSLPELQDFLRRCPRTSLRASIACALTAGEKDVFPTDAACDDLVPLCNHSLQHCRVSSEWAPRQT
jgi:hypothetical protein